jgi:hypothetical protein
MKRRSAEPLTKVTLNLYTQDVEKMKEAYPQVGYSVAIKFLVREHVTKLAQREAQLLETIGEIDIDV